ncbi:ribosomal RNA small subunit methyltransferase A [Candidatus Bathyarchaeota archaeon]|nr:ribosomal RNA small subunit methyltransferase A [Candidatus Bathyarchaeota archaeon]
MGLLEETKRILYAYKIYPKRKLGQNFLVDGKALDKMINYASINEDDYVLEIGAGLGFLTERLAEIAKQVIAIEIDPRLIRVLTNRLRKYKNVTILKGDVLKVDVPKFNKVVSVPPYSISSPLLFWLLRRKFECAVLAFQEEFAKRLAASAGVKDYGRLTVSVYCHAEVDLLDAIPKESFWPIPEVNSMIVHLKPRRMPFHVENEEEFFDFIREIFTQKNKKLRNAISPFLTKVGIPKEEIIKVADSIPFNYRRARDLMPEELGLAFNELIKKLQDIRKTF